MRLELLHTVDKRLVIDSIYLIDLGWVDYASQTIVDHGFKYYYYLHTTSDPVEIGGGPYGRQIIYPLELSSFYEEFIVSSIEHLDTLVDISFERTWDQSAASMRFFLDSEIDIDGDPLGIVTANGTSSQRWFEILLDGNKLTDQFYWRYAFLHEFGHSLGLEHPFNDQDGDSFGGIDPWTSDVFPEDTVMAYRRPSTGEWPQWFSPSDIRALVETWGLENDERGIYQFSRLSTGQSLMIGDPEIARQITNSGKCVLQGFKPSQSEVYGSESDDDLIGQISDNEGWTHEWFYAGAGDDLIRSGGGRDQLLGGLGDDTLRGGHGQDVIEGGLGNDHLYGGGGRNTLLPGEGDDSIFILSDHVSHGEFAGRHHSGNLADVIFDVDYNDRITILGCATEELNVVALDDGYGIKAKGVLEAILLDSQLDQAGIARIVSADETRWF